MAKKNNTLTLILLLLVFAVAAQNNNKDAKTQKSEPPTSTSQSNQEFTVNGVTFKMIYAEGGTFTMGDNIDGGGLISWLDNEPAHSVTVSDFLVGETEVTQALWTAVMGSNPSHFKGDDLPVECVSWDDCQKFIRKLNKLTGETFRLPTEAEWEYAARGGNKSKGYWYAGSGSIGDVAWVRGSMVMRTYCTHPVKGKKPNELGLFDMSGNVAEWCRDWYSSDYYIVSPSDNPTGPFSPDSWKRRVLRGGSWHSNNDYDSQVFYRYNSSHYYFSKSKEIGFRLALVHPSDVQKKVTEAKRQEKKARAEKASLLKAKELFNKEQYAEALPLLKASAEQGLAFAQSKLGDMYRYGQGVDKNPNEAVKWYKMAAEQGYAPAQDDLGEMYEKGDGVSQDYAEAVKWYKKAAEGGAFLSSYTLGQMYFHGDGVAQDYAEAAKWYMKAAEQGGHTLSQNMLGIMYERGIGVPQDCSEAVKWYKKILEEYEIPSVQNRLGCIYYLGGNGVSRDYYEAAKWFAKAAAGGDPDAQYHLGSMLEEGQGVGKNRTEAVKWYRQAAKQDNELAKKALIRLGEKW